MYLSELGWHPHFDDSWQELRLGGCVPARIVRQDRGSYRVHTETGILDARLAGRLRQTVEATGTVPVVGDWVAASVEHAPAVLHAVLPRRTTFSRKVAGEVTREQVVAANVDTVLIVCGLDGDFNLRRIERYVAQAWNGGAAPVVLLNKADACDDLDGRRLAAEAAAPGVDVWPVSAARGDGLDALAPYLLLGQTVALVGSSGVGKSTLVNRLLGADRMRTAEVRAADSRGRHTTTHRELLVLPGGALLIDTPGMRELQVWGDAAGVDAAFPDVEALAESCRFRDCTHDDEPECAVRAAVEDGLLEPGRLQSYRKLHRELAYLAGRQAGSSTFREHQRNRVQGRRYRQVSKHNPKNRRG